LRRPKISLRITLLSSIVLLLVLIFAIVWISASRGLRSSVEVMAQSLSSEVLARVEEKTKAQLERAELAGEQAANRLVELEETEGHPLAASDLPEITRIFHEIIQAHPSLSSISVSFVKGGEYAHVQRKGGVLSAVEMNAPVNGVASQKHISYKNGNRIVTQIEPKHRYDPRTRPFFNQVKNSAKPIWTDSYAFVEANGETYPGLSLAVPIRVGGRLAYIVTADFSSAQLCEFLQGIQVGNTGYAFVADDRENKGSTLLAHPVHTTLLEPQGKTTDIVRIGQVRDATLRQVMLHMGRNKSKDGAFTGKIVGADKRDKREFFVSYTRLAGTPSPGLSIGTIVPASELTGSLAAHEMTITTMGIIALGLGLILSWLISMAVSRPLMAAVRQLSQVSSMDFNLPPVMGSVLTEVNDLAVSVEQMKLSLRSFSRYVPTDLVTRVLATGAEPVLGGEMRQLTVHFCDIAGFSAVAEKMPPHELLQLLSECLGELSEEITLSGGTIDKYIGDSIMAFWGAPEPLPDHATIACRALLRNCHRMEELRIRLLERNLPPLHVRMALHSGNALVGNIGSEHRLNYSVLGDTVNVASRLENLNRYYKTQILISDATREAIGEKLIARPVDWVRVEGREGTLEIFEPFGFEGEMTPGDEQRAKQVVEMSQQALELYRVRKWDEAARYFDAILEILPGDGVASLFKASCQVYSVNPPADEWDGVEQTFKL